MAQADNKENQAFDLDSERVGGVYAKALLGASEASGDTDVVIEELSSLVHDVFNKSPELEQWIGSMRLSHEQRLPLLDKAFAGKMNPTLLTFLKVVSSKGRIDCLRAIEHSARQLYNNLRGKLEVHLKTAEPMTAEVIDSVTNALVANLGHEVDLKTSIDSNIIGGLVIRIGDTVIDGSVANQLEQLRRKTLDASQRQAKDALDRFTEADSE
ncbi:MAG: ATP synthase F1 subunit delta [Pirellulales bacterium]